MTLIPNYLDSDKIIIASDKRRTIGDSARDNSAKLLPGDNYVIGINGTVANYKQNHYYKIHELISHNKYLHPLSFVDKFKQEIRPFVEDGKELNITVSGAYDNELVSLYYQSKEDIKADCIKEDIENIRFNGDNSEAEQLFRQGFIFIENGLVSFGIWEKKLFKRPKLTDFKESDIINALKLMYEQFHENNFHYPGIGGEMDYCIIHKSGKIEKYIN